MMKDINLLITGISAVDYIAKVDTLPDPNQHVSMDKLNQFYGGPAVNTAMTCGTLGMNVGLFSCFGGEYDIERLVDNNIDVSCSLIDYSYHSTVTYNFIDNNNISQSYYDDGASKNFDNILKHCYLPDALKDINNIHIATGKPNFNVLCSSLCCDKFLSVDFGQDLHYYHKNEVKYIIENCNVLFGNDKEISKILYLLDKTIDDLLCSNVDLVVRTCADKGSICYSREGNFKSDVVLSNVVDPTGCGDAFRGAFLYNYLQNKDLQYCMDFASTVSSFVIEKIGAQTNLPSLEQVNERMNNK